MWMAERIGKRETKRKCLFFVDKPRKAQQQDLQAKNIDKHDFAKYIDFDAKRNQKKTTKENAICYKYRLAKHKNCMCFCNAPVFVFRNSYLLST